ncbi:efflux RND transporter periplasmic adaptor subunit [Aliiglaciecola lipolytica]|uniref:CusB-like beta-barrel domain-containing protein n=1 Tax=Aliiglaciecola lipolytica E3 TaxID=1127673 RepID=K6YEG5_9ALTE|nr:efflux RND transporter periplasmic adaptor subunit [Aliiglaciecola lipolytica]GAC16562.1 hypothetical protein GLIP_3951 [Aliiglaciecola lipolytica E3]
MTTEKNASTTKKLVPIVIVILTIILSFWLLDSGEVEKRANKSVHKKTRVVKVVPFTKQTVVPKWQTSGLVSATESVVVTPEISGVIEDINTQAIPGALLDKDTWLVKLEAEDYLLNLQTQQAQLDNSQAKLELELADQRLAQEELNLLTDIDNMKVDMALVLREPQLKSAEAQITIAQVNLKKAQVNLQRTQVTMPFKGMIERREAGVGSRVGLNTQLFEIINVDRFWLEVKVPRSFLALLDTQATASVTQPSLWTEEQQRSAKFVSVLPSLDEKDRQVKLLYEIENPLSEYPEIYIHDFLKVELSGVALKDSWAVQAGWIQSDNTIWVVDKNKRLAKRNVEIQFKGQEIVYVKGDIQKTDLALNEQPRGAIEGMEVRPRRDKVIELQEQQDAE